MPDTRRTPRQIESRMQQAFIAAVRRMPWGAQVVAHPNQAARTVANASRMKAEGMMAGIWDVQVLIPSQGYHGMFIEFKAPADKLAGIRAGKLSETQQAFRERTEPHGYRFEVHTNAGEAFEAVRRYVEGVF